MKKKDDFNLLEERLTKQLKMQIMEIRYLFVPTPSASCCGKPIVFGFPNKTFECHICGKKWRLILKVVEETDTMSPKLRKLARKWKKELGYRDCGAAAKKTWAKIEKIATPLQQLTLHGEVNKNHSF